MNEDLRLQDRLPGDTEQGQLSPKAIQYRPNSIIYFKGDASDKIYILNKGKVSLNYIDIETGQDIHDTIKVGEFFGVRSALGRYPREDTAIAAEPSTVIAFTVPEFEQLASKNTRIIMKMLKVFSTQLRRIHKRVQNLLTSTEQISQESGLYKIGEHYLNTRSYSQAIYAFGRYLVYYPSGKHAAEASRKLAQAEEYMGKYGQGKGPAPEGTGPRPAVRPSRTRQLSDTAQRYYSAVSLVTEEKYQEALAEFQAILSEGGDAEYATKSQYEMGRCLFFMGQHEKCVRLLTDLIQKYPKHPDMKDALFFIARSNQQRGESNVAQGLYRKLLSMTSENDSLHRKVVSAMRELENGT